MRRTTFTRRQVAAVPAAFIALKATSALAQQVETASPVASPVPGATSMSLEANKTLVSSATNAVFNQHDVDAVDRYFSPTYIQHSTLIGDGPEALKGLVSSMSADVTYQPVRLFADGDLVAAHGLYTGFGPVPFVAFDLFRIENGLIAEHWDGLQLQVEETASGHTQLDGPTDVTEPGKTGENRAFVEGFVDTILIGAEYDKIPQHFNGDAYIQHNPAIADGVSGLGTAVAALAEQGLSLQYNARHRTVAEGEFVLVQSDGNFGNPVVYYDLFRVENGFIAEHWDVVQEIPASIPHENGLY